MTSQEITILNNDTQERATIEYDRTTCTLSISFIDGTNKTYSALDIYICFGLLRKEFSHIKFMCKGAKINVHTSAMSSQMSNGLVAYEVTMGESDGKLVRIFDYEEHDLTNDIQEQISFRDCWANSL